MITKYYANKIKKTFLNYLLLSNSFCLINFIRKLNMRLN